MDLGDLDLLLTREALDLVDRIDAALLAKDPAGVISTLRKSGASAELVRVAADQASLRVRAHAKFGDAASLMLFTRAGLEQATRREVAAVHTARMRAAGVTSVADLGCGIGGDSIAYAAVGLAVIAIDADPVTAAIAAYNLRPFADSVTVRAQRAEDAEIAEGTAVWLDPARRTAGHSETRRVGAADYTPSLDWIDTLRERGVPMGVKLSPAHDRTQLPDAAEAQWISHDGSTVELVLWSGALKREGTARAALVLRGDEAFELTAAADVEDEPVHSLGEFIHEPDGAVIRARLVGDVARMLDAGPVAHGVGYLTSDADMRSPFAATFRVLDEVPPEPGKLKSVLRERGIGALEIKKRGVDLDPPAFRKQLALRGDESATLIVTKIGSKRRAFLAERAPRA